MRMKFSAASPAISTTTRSSDLAPGQSTLGQKPGALRAFGLYPNTPRLVRKSARRDEGPAALADDHGRLAAPHALDRPPGPVDAAEVVVPGAVEGRSLVPQGDSHQRGDRPPHAGGAWREVGQLRRRARHLLPDPQLARPHHRGRAAVTPGRVGHRHRLHRAAGEDHGRPVGRHGVASHAGKLVARRLNAGLLGPRPVAEGDGADGPGPRVPRDGARLRLEGLDDDNPAVGCLAAEGGPLGREVMSAVVPVRKSTAWAAGFPGSVDVSQTARQPSGAKWTPSPPSPRSSASVASKVTVPVAKSTFRT